MPSPPRNLGQGISVAYLTKKTRSDHVTRNALATWNNETYEQVKADSRSVSLKTLEPCTGHGNFVVGRFHTRARKWIIRQRLACVQSPPSPTDTPFPFFSEGRGLLLGLSRLCS